MKTVLITGVSRGIGLKTCEAFLKEGYTVFGCSRTVTSEINALLSKGLIFISCDVSSQDEVKHLFEVIHSHTDHLDVVVNNAGIWKGGLLQNMQEEDFDALVNVNLKGPFLILKEALPLMISKGSGSIINVSSMWGIDGASFESLYSMTKGGLNALTKSLSKELAPSGIRVNAIAPGAIDTQMNASYSPEDRREIEHSIGLGRFGTPEEVAQLILFLASEKAGYITGEIIRIDGLFGF